MVKPVVAEVRFNRETLFQIGMLLFLKAGVPRRHAEWVVEHLLSADECGYRSHGFQRVLQYVANLLKGDPDPRARPRVSYHSLDAASVEGRRTLGRVTMETAINTALKLLDKNNVSSASVTVMTHHVGRLYDYIKRIAESGYIATAICNATGSPTTSLLSASALGGTNPYAWGVPRKDGGALVLDFTPAASTEGEIRALVNARCPVPCGVIIDCKGQSTTNGRMIYWKKRRGAVLPLGGERLPPMGHMLMFGDFIPGALTNNLQTVEMPVRGMNAVLLTVYDPARLGTSREQYVARVEEACAYVKSERPLNATVTGSDGKILLAGEPEREAMAISRERGVALTRATWLKLRKLASGLGVSLEKLRPMVCA